MPVVSLSVAWNMLDILFPYPWLVSPSLQPLQMFPRAERTLTFSFLCCCSLRQVIFSSLFFILCNPSPSLLGCLVDIQINVSHTPPPHFPYEEAHFLPVTSLSCVTTNLEVFLITMFSPFFPLISIKPLGASKKMSSGGWRVVQQL